MLLHSKVNVIASSRNLQRPILSGFKLDTTKTFMNKGSPLHYQQVGISMFVAECLEYAIDALFIHRSTNTPSWKTR